ncbi:MAG: hypothetical protein JWL59_4654 [Chthoniobacteraceae bacterium]|nr:hypothetical protein [Chthoniobacteraceae bacterium]
MGGGLLAVFLFSLTMPMMRLAEADFQPAVVGVGRLAIGAPLAALVLVFLGWPRMGKGQVARLFFVTACLGFGFAFLLALALREVPSYHAAIVTGSIPLFTALMAAWRGGRRQTPGFWCAALAGSMLVAGYGIAKSGWILTSADLMLLLAAAACGIGYAEGAKLGAEIGQSRLACLMPIAAAPFAVALCWNKLPADWSHIAVSSWVGLLYNAWVSAFGAFFFWYAALHRGGTARVGQLQLMQPFFTLSVSAIFLHEAVSRSDWITASLVIGCVFTAQRAGHPPRQRLTHGPAPAEVTGT